GEMGLLQALYPTYFAGEKTCWLGGGSDTLLQRREQSLRLVKKLLVLDGPSGNQHHRAGFVMRVHVSRAILAYERRDGFDIAQNGPTHRLIRKTGHLQIVENKIVRRVFGLADFLDDHFLLAQKLVAREGRAQENVR